MKKLLAAGFPAALFAAGLLLPATGVLRWASFLDLAGRTLPILVFVAAMTVVSELADSAGVFRAVTAGLAGGRGAGRPGRGGRPSGQDGPPPARRVVSLWLLVVLLATVSTIFLSLDTTAVLVTPLVVSLARHARIHPLPFALTTVWLANTASLLLPVSNLTNLLAQQRLGVSPLEFAGLLWAPALVGVAVPVALLFLMFGKDLRGRYAAPQLPPVADKPLLVLSGATVALLLPALVTGVPVWIPASAAALFMVVVFVVRHRAALHWTTLPTQPLLLAMGLFLVVQALHDHGLATALAHFCGSGDGFPALLQLTVTGALGANAANNLPAYLALEPVAGSPVRLAALLVGVNLGPLVSPWASLATLLWHSRLTALGITVAWRGYALAGAAVVAVLLPLAVLALWLGAGMPA